MSRLESVESVLEYMHNNGFDGHVSQTDVGCCAGFVSRTRPYIIGRCGFERTPLAAVLAAKKDAMIVNVNESEKESEQQGVFDNQNSRMLGFAKEQPDELTEDQTVKILLQGYRSHDDTHDHHKKMRHAAQALLAVHGATKRELGWQPIETAPKDRRIIGAWKNRLWHFAEIIWRDGIDEWENTASDYYEKPTHWISYPTNQIEGDKP